MRNQGCAWCCEAPASVFTADLPLCRRCHADMKRMEQEDNAVPNRPICGDCGVIDCIHIVELVLSGVIA